MTKEQIISIAEACWESNGMTLYPVQKEILVDDSDNIVVNKARGIGMSYVLAFKCLVNALLNKKEIILVSQDKPNSEHLLKYIIEFQKFFADNPVFPRMTACGRDLISFANGSTIYSKSSDPKTLRGLHGDVLWDEAAYTENDKEMRTAITGCLLPNFNLMMSSTPCEQTGVFFETCKGAKKSKHWKMYEIPFDKIPNEAYHKKALMEKERATEEGWIEEWHREYMCQFIDGSTRLFNHGLIASCFYTEKPNIKPETAGADFGQKVDNAVYSEVGRYKEHMYCLNAIEYNLGEDYGFQLDSMEANVKAKGLNKFYVDATGVGNRLIEELHKRDIGYLTEGITFTNAVKEKMAMFLYSNMLQGKIKIPRDYKKLIDQMYSIKRTRTEDGRNRYKHEDGKHDDHFWAFCLALMYYIENNETNENIAVDTMCESKFSSLKEELWNS